MTFLDFLQAATETAETKLRREAKTMLERVDYVWDLMNEELRGLFGVKSFIDEMALYFPDRDLLFTFIGKAVQNGWVLFNFSEDTVMTSPIPSEYGVEYWFLMHPDHSYRLELMTVPDGISPYHSAIQASMQKMSRPAALVHASFKVPDESTYASAVVTLRQAGYELAQHCTSSYGRFSYFLSDNVNLTALKPRLNMRDGGDDSE
jgi:hypothetical protein